MSVRWKAEDGSRHAGTVPLPRRRGSTATRLWVADHGARLASRPPSPAQGTVIAVGCAAGVGLLFLLARLTIQEEFDRIRMREREREWAEEGPGWSGGLE